MLVKLVRSRKIAAKDAADELGVSFGGFEGMMKSRAW